MGQLHSGLNTLCPITLQNKQKPFPIQLRLKKRTSSGKACEDAGALESTNGERDLSGMINNSINTPRKYLYFII